MLFRSTGSDEIQEGLFRQLGIVRAYDYPELCDVALILMQGKPWTVTHAPRVLALSGSGGLGTFFGDLASIAGLDLPPLEAAEKEIFKEAADDPSKLQNPMDLSGLASGNHNRYAEALRAAVCSERYDVAVPIISVAKSYAPLIERVEPALAAGHKRLAVIGIPCQVYALRALQPQLEREQGLQALYVIGTP